MPVCKVDYERSEIREYSNEKDAGHRYLHLVMIPVDLNLIQQAFMGNLSEYTINIFPKRKADMSIDDEFENALIDAFNNKQLQNTMVERIEVKIPPTFMTYTSGERKGQWIADSSGNSRVYNNVQMMCVMKKKADGEGYEPTIPINRLEAQALRMRDQRIQSGVWASAVEEIDQADVANVVEVVEEEVETTPQTPQRPQPQARRQ